MIDCTFTNNSASSYSGGAILIANNDSNANMIDCTFTNNTSDYNGGAIWIYYNSNASMVDCTFANNTASNSGGAICIATSWTMLSNCSIVTNSAGSSGGGAYFAGGQSNWDSVRFECNLAHGAHDDYNDPGSSVFNCSGCEVDNCSSTSTSTTAPSPTSAINPAVSTFPTSGVSSTTSLVPSTTTPWFSSNCSIQACPNQGITEQSGSSSNATWVVLSNSTEVQLTVTTNDGSSISYQVGWGAIREITSNGELVKSADPVLENWLRTITQNETTVTITYSTIETRDPWQNEPIFIALTTVLNFANDSEAVASAKFSLQIEGNWSFASPTNSLEADFILRASFEDLDECGKKQSYRLETSSDEDTYHFGSANSSAVALSILRYCTADDLRRDTNVLEPVFFDNHTAVRVTIGFPVFESSLYYDPNFAVLLGFTGFSSSSSCNALFAWILPVSFLGAAIVAILVVIGVSYIPAAQPLLFGKEATRVNNLRKFVSDNEIGLNADVDLR